AGLTFWALDAYLGGRWRRAAAWFSLAVLAKETAVLAPLALLGWEILSRLPFQHLKGLDASETTSLKRSPDANSDTQASTRSPGLAVFVSLLAPVAILAAWYAYHYSRTGYIFGNPEFFRYNVQATLSGVRIALAFLM